QGRRGETSRTSVGWPSRRLVIHAEGQAGSTNSSTVRSLMKPPRLGDDAAILSPRALPAGIRPAGERIDTRPGLEKCCAALGRQGWIGQVLDTRSAAPAATSLPS